MMPMKMMPMKQLWTTVQSLPDDKLYKRMANVYCVLEKCEDTISNEERKVVDPRFAKYRFSKLKVLLLYDMEVNKKLKRLNWKLGWRTTLYETGQIVEADWFDPDLERVCTGGIHAFHHKLAALCYTGQVVPNDIDFNDDGTVRRATHATQKTDKNWIGDFYGVDVMMSDRYVDPK